MMIPLCMAVSCLVYAVFYRTADHAARLLLMLGLFFWAFHKRPALPRGALSLEAYEYGKRLHGKYSKSTFNTLFLRFVLLARAAFPAARRSARPSPRRG